ncbi:MAG: YggS family pyridoxal phosphate-dependent enzyme [Dehalococcoidia bacterium]|nr:YggS family pyridoxal phosphate-dependent enzyme [Dehalococcoidia bacterium]
MTTPTRTTPTRTTSTPLAARLADVRARIVEACERVGRDPASVTLVGVSKTQPPEVVREAIAAGLLDLGENRAQDLLAQAQAPAAAGLAPRWHFIGHLQRNKVREVLPHIYALHSLDSARLIEEMERRWDARGAAGPPPGRLPCYIEVNIGGEAQKTGIAPAALPALLASASASPVVAVTGLMTVAPQVVDPEETRPIFRALRELAAAHGLRGLSMGMTEDYPVAIEEGATVVRVGRAIFGERRA